MDPGAASMMAVRQWCVGVLHAKQRCGSAKGTATLNRAMVRWLETCLYHSVAPPQELIDLIARQLKADKLCRNQGSTRQREIAAIAIARDSGVSDKKLAQACGVSRPTVANWKADPSFKWTVATFNKMFEHMTKDEQETVLKGVQFPWQQLRHKVS